MNITCNVCGGSEFNKQAGFYYCNECQTQTQDIREQAEEESPYQKVGKKIKSAKKATDEQHITSVECYNYILRGLVEELIEIGANPKLKTIVRILWLRYLKAIEFLTDGTNQPPKLAAVYSETDAELLYGRKRKRCRIRSKSPVTSSDIPSTSADNLLKSRTRKRHKRALAKAEYEEFANSKLSERKTSLQNQSLSSLKGDNADQTSKPVPLQFNKTAEEVLKSLMGEKHLEAHINDVSGELSCHRPTYKQFPKSYRHSADIVSKNKLFAIIYLGLLIIKDRIQLGDLLRFVKEGHVSYHKLDHFLPESVKGIYTQRHLTRMNIQNSHLCLTHEGIRRMAATIASKIDVIKFIPIQNLEFLLKRYCKELNLSDEICSCSIKLLTSLKPRLKFRKGDKLIPNYEGRAMALIIFTMKLFFGLDGGTEYYLSDFATKINNMKKKKEMFVWKDWIDYIEFRKLVISNIHMTYTNKFCAERPEIFIDYTNKQKKKYGEVEKNLTKEQEIYIGLLDKLRKLQKEPKTYPNFKPSLTPFLYYSAVILKEGFNKEKIKLEDLDKNFSSQGLDYLYSPYIYMQQIYGDCPIAVKHRGVINDLHLKNYVNRNSERAKKRKRECSEVTIKVIDDEDMDTNRRNEVSENSDDIRNRLHIEATKVYLKVFETKNIDEFRNNIKKMKKKVINNETGDSVQNETDESIQVERSLNSSSESSSNEKQVHYNAFERYWLNMEDVTRSTKAEFKTFYKELPYNFRLVLQECARICQNTRKELYIEFTNVEVFTLYSDLNGFDRKMSTVFVKDNLKYLKQKVSKMW